MLRRDGEPSQGSFADLARAVRTVPEEHVLLRIRRAIRWKPSLAPVYDRERDLGQGGRRSLRPAGAWPRSP